MSARIRTEQGTCRRARARGALVPLGTASVLLGLIPAGLLPLSGCGRALFPDQANRSQYDRYDRIRQDFAAQHETDEFGRRKPNLRGRLSPDR